MNVASNRTSCRQLEDLGAGCRTNDTGTMQAYTKGLTDEQIDALAQYVANLN